MITIKIEKSEEERSREALSIIDALRGCISKVIGKPGGSLQAHLQLYAYLGRCMCSSKFGALTGEMESYREREREG